MENKIAIISTLIAIFTSIFGGLTWIDNRYAKNEDLMNLKTTARLNQIEVTKMKVLSIKHSTESGKEAVINDVLKQLEDEAIFLRQKLDN